MRLLKVVCPTCRSRLTIQGVTGIQDKVLECPICKYKAKVSLYLIGQAGKGGNGASDSPTELPDAFKSKINNDIGQLRVIQTGQICELRMGDQTLGRLAKTGTADMQIGSDNYIDDFMSRCHVKISVIKNAMGIEHHLVEIGSKNIIQLNGKDIMRGDELKLNFGDKITLGKTELIFEESDEESTKVL